MITTASTQPKLSGQVGRYILTGILNTGIDITLLYILSRTTGIHQGTALFGLSMISFAIATINSFFLNKYWTFKERSGKQGTQFTQFLAVSITGALINSGVVTLVATYIPPFLGLNIGIDEKYWVVAAKLVATCVSLIWNFLGYKRIVFKKREDTANSNTQ